MVVHGLPNLQDVAQAVWALARSQHFVVSRAQSIELGVHPQAIKHRVASGRLHPVHRGVYAVGRRELTRYGELMSAVLASGDPSGCSATAPPPGCGDLGSGPESR